MLNKKEFKEIRKELEDYDQQRENLIKKGRDLLKLSKQVIYSLHRHNLKETNLLIKQVKKEKLELDMITKKDKLLLLEPSYSDALQEYTEAFCYYSLVMSKKIPTRKLVGVDTENYLMGLCDLTGELTRRAVSLATRRMLKELVEIKELVEELYGEFLKFNLRNGSLRRKSDSIKWNLKKLEEIVYDMKIRKI